MYFKRGVTAVQTMKALHDLFEKPDAPQEGARDITRRQALRGLMASAAGLALASLPGGNEADAAEQDSFDKRRAMRNYSKDPDRRGIGVFINLQRDAPISGDQIGQWLQKHYAAETPPVAVDYRVNQSRGAATDLTFYVGGHDFIVNVGDLQGKLDTMLAHHRDVWPTGQATLSSLEK